MIIVRPCGCLIDPIVFGHLVCRPPRLKGFRHYLSKNDEL